MLPRFTARGVRLAGVSVDAPETSRAMHHRLSLGFPLLSDPEMKMIKAYGVVQEGRDLAVPALFLLDSKHRIVWSDVADDYSDRPGAGEVLARVPGG